jgi:hypothetical protein
LVWGADEVPTPGARLPAQHCCSKQLKQCRMPMAGFLDVPGRGEAVPAAVGDSDGDDGEPDQAERLAAEGPQRRVEAAGPVGPTVGATTTNRTPTMPSATPFAM